MPQRHIYPTSGAQHGLTLVELMTSLAIGLLITLAIGYLYTNSRQTYRMNDNIARIQENARFAIETISRDVRMAGYMGCGNLALPGFQVNVIANNPPTTTLTLANALTGVETGANGNWANVPNGYTHAAGTDVIRLQRASDVGAQLTGNMDAVNAQIHITPVPDGTFQAGDVLLITDCSSADLFRATSVSKSNNKISIAHAQNQNTSNNLSKAYQADARVMRYVASTYFIGINNAGNRALYHIPWSGDTQGVPVEIAENVENMQITYGVDTNNVPDGAVDVFETAADVTLHNRWDRVLSVRVRLLLVSPDDNLTDAPQAFSLVDTNGDGIPDPVTATDRRLRYVFTTTIGLRNRLP